MRKHLFGLAVFSILTAKFVLPLFALAAVCKYLFGG